MGSLGPAGGQQGAQYERAMSGFVDGTETGILHKQVCLEPKAK